MNKTFLFKCDFNFNQERFFALAEDAGIDTKTVRFHSATQGEFKADSTFYSELYRLLKPLTKELSGKVTVLVASKYSEFSERLLQSACAYFPGEAVYPSQVIMREIGYNNYQSYAQLMNIFRPALAEKDVFDTAATYLCCGLDGKSTAKAMFIHRNTFNYRLAAFIRLTGVDIRDYHNALLFELYLTLRHIH